MSPVSVLAAGSVGPYDYQVIMVNPANSDPAMVAIEWLTANGYDVGALGPDVLRPYLRDNLNLLAFKLSKNKMAGSIRPVMLTYNSDHPMIPIRPTAVAANDDMGILVWVLGSGRAVPTNYKTLELNEAVIDWFNPAMVYNDVVAAAADEAGGQGFVTELAQPTATSGIADTLYQERFNVEQFRNQADAQSDAELIVAVVNTFNAFASRRLRRAVRLAPVGHAGVAGRRVGRAGQAPEADGGRGHRRPVHGRAPLLPGAVPAAQHVLLRGQADAAQGGRHHRLQQGGVPDRRRGDDHQADRGHVAAVPRPPLHDPVLHDHVGPGHDAGSGLRSQPQPGGRQQPAHAGAEVPGHLPG